MIKTRQDLLKVLKEGNKLVPATLILFVEYSLQNTRDFMRSILDRMDLPHDLHDETRKSILVEAIRGQYQSLLINIAVVLKLPEDDLDMEVNPEVVITEDGVRLNQGLPDWIFLFMDGCVSFQECDKNNSKVADMFSEETKKALTERIDTVMKRKKELIKTLVEKLDNKQKLLKEILSASGGTSTIN